ncbi:MULTISPECIES: aminodeoxychorismate lyase [Bacillus]|uniref:aminodeoxychorismate lyase n=1 Tax=Bacillus TaxID=1386 RepID=UPI000BB96202|nr:MULTISPECIES: aminodeoxychorismate lyase [Bacillus]
MRVFKDGEILSVDKATVSVMDHGFMYGVGLFETIKVIQNNPILLEEHLVRLKDSLDSVFVQWDYSESEVRDAIKKTLRANQLTDAVIRLNVTAGVAEWGLPTEHYEQPSTIIYARPLPPMTQESKEACILKIKRNTPEGPFRLKSHHYLNNLLAKRELVSRPSNTEGIFLTEEGYVAEGIISNIFWVKNGKVFTPCISTGILNGITRQLVIHLLKLLNIEVEEGFFKKESLLNSDEVFFTNSVQDVTPVKKLESKMFDASNFSIVQKLQGILKECPSSIAYVKDIKEIKIDGNAYKVII